MPWNTVKLTPGINTQFTPVLNEAGISQSNEIRFKDGLVQKLGGWTKYYTGTINSTIRELHAWQGLKGDKFLAIGTPSQLAFINAGTQSFQDITPQVLTTNSSPNFSITASSNVVTVVDNSTYTVGPTLFDTVYFTTPVAVGGTFLSGPYAINTVGGSSTYTIVSTANSSSTVTSSGILPQFTTTAGSAIVTVTLPNNNYIQATGLFYPYFAATSVGGLTIGGAGIGYEVSSIIDSTQFIFLSTIQSSGSDTQYMNGGKAQMVYYRGIGPTAAGGGYGVGGYGLGGWGMGSGTSAGSGTPITANDWTFDNWGDVILACAEDGPLYQWASGSGFTTATVVTNAPFFSGGLFISQPQQILVMWRSTQNTGVQDNLIVRWSDAGDYTNFVVSADTTAGSFHIPTGSKIMGGYPGGTRAIICTDVDAWIMQYVGGDVIFNFTNIGTGCGLIGKHAIGYMNETLYWMGFSNFFALGPEGVDTLRCSVWDFIFQNINQNYTSKVRCATNSMFDEVTWYFPSLTSQGENDSYVRFNAVTQEWDYGSLVRTAWIDITALGSPIGTDLQNIYQHEVSNNQILYNADTQPINASFTTGYWTIAEGEQMAFVDFLVPDMKYGPYGGSSNASILITINAVDYPEDTPRTYGPVTFTSTTEYLTPRLRGRYMNMEIQSQDLDSFWRMGGVKYRWAPAGRR